jgi:hypothetical protein
VVLPGQFSNNFSENLASSEDTIPTRRPGVRLPGRIPGIPVLQGHSTILRQSIQTGICESELESCALASEKLELLSGAMVYAC